MRNRFTKRALLCVFSTVLSVHTVSASLVISELFYDASGTDAGQVFVELFGTPGESLDGLVLEGINGTGGTVYTSLNLSGVIPGDGVFVIGDNNGGSTSVPNADLIADIDYQNGPDSVVLRNDAVILDAVGYGSFGGSSIFAGEGAAATDPASGSSIARFNPLLDSGDNSVDFIVLETPTPGVVPLVSSVPLPAGIWLFISGLLPLLSCGFLRRSRHIPVAT
ncbi:MAG: hypothetical protein BMS9Abin09_0191 [Gammaproteobacteria bacterium]|nr:MAG: hypothetical protein BMS9Abin09_0191 [Gammaproteobacteria bacterium]